MRFIILQKCDQGQIPLIRLQHKFVRVKIGRVLAVAAPRGSVVYDTFKLYHDIDIDTMYKKVSWYFFSTWYQYQYHDTI